MNAQQGKGKIYIAGPMRGKDHLNFEQFFCAAKMLRQEGWEPWNPAAHDVDNWWEGIQFDPKKGLMFDLQKLDECSAIYMLEGWEESVGAQCEFHYATFIGLDIWYQIDDKLVEEVTYKTLKGVVCVNDRGADWWTKGKFYPYVEGEVSSTAIYDDDGDLRCSSVDDTRAFLEVTV